MPLKVLAPQLNDEEERDFVSQGFKSRLLLEIPGRMTNKKSNVVLVQGEVSELDDADFVPFLRLVLALFESDDGFVARDSLKYGFGIDGEGALMPQGVDQALARMRKPFRGRIGNLSRLEFIEAQRGRIRLSTHRHYIQVDEAVLLKHLDERVQSLARRISQAKIRSASGAPEAE